MNQLETAVSCGVSLLARTAAPRTSLPGGAGGGAQRLAPRGAPSARARTSHSVTGAVSHKAGAAVGSGPGAVAAGGASRQRWGRFSSPAFSPHAVAAVETAHELPPAHSGKVGGGGFASGGLKSKKPFAVGGDGGGNIGATARGWRL